MVDFDNFSHGYGLSFISLILVTAYFVVTTLIVRRPGPARVSVPRYQPPAGTSPAVAAWLLERNLSRAVAAAFVNMAAKGYLGIEQSQDLFTVTQIRPPSVAALEPEEDALNWRLFRRYDSFDFVQVTPELIDAVKGFQWALQDTTYFSPSVLLSVPAWILSALGTLLALANTHFWQKLGSNSARLLIAAAIIAFLSSVLTVRTLGGTIEKLLTRLPGSTEPQRPWTGTDTSHLVYLCVSLLGICLVGQLSITSGLVTFGFLAVNGIFYHSMQGLTAMGRRVLAQISDYRQFLSEVEAPAISRLHVADHVPSELSTQDAYAVAFHLDLGWGEQFVSCISDLVELAALSKSAEEAA